MTKLYSLVAVCLSLTGCSWRYGSAPFSFNGKQYDIVCPDPPPQHPDVIVGSTPCVYVLRKH